MPRKYNMTLSHPLNAFTAVGHHSFCGQDTTRSREYNPNHQYPAGMRAPSAARPATNGFFKAAGRFIALRRCL
jgi:hypothetical protein